jgi:hypothetical protein
MALIAPVRAPVPKLVDVLQKAEVEILAYPASQSGIDEHS